MQDTKILSETGMAESLDSKRTQVNLNNLKVEIQKLNTLKTLSLNLLKFQMGMPMETALGLSDNLENLSTSLSNNDSSTDYENNIDVQLLKMQRELQEINLKNEKIRLLPSLAAFGTVGANYGTNELGEMFNFGDYRGYSLVGLQLNVPIWSSGQRKFRIEQAKFEVEKLDNNMSLLKQNIDLQFQQQKDNLKDNQQVLKIRKESMDLAQDVYNSTKIKFDEGVTSNFELLSTQTDLKTSQTNYYNALYDVLVAQIELNLITGKSNIE